MPDLSSLFDRTGTVRRPPYGRLLDEFRIFFSDCAEPPSPQALPNGRGQAVLVLPGFLTGDIITRPLRQFVEACGFRAFGWEHGVNVGPTPGAMAHLRGRVDQLAALNGGPIALVGISLGGLLARYIAYDCPEQIRHVATLASPFRLPTASTFEPLVRLCEPLYTLELRLDLLSGPLPTPSTAFFTRDDGIVAWESCRSDDPDCTNIEVTGPHMAIGRNPDMLAHLVRVLAPPG